MEIRGTVIDVLPTESGTKSSGGTWKKGGVVIKTGGQYPQDICLTLWGDKADILFKKGQVITAHFDLSSREYNGRWYTEAKAYKIDFEQSKPAQTAPPPPQQMDDPFEAEPTPW